MRHLSAAMLAAVVLASPVAAQTSANVNVEATVTSDLVVVVDGSTNYGTIGNGAATYTLGPASLGAGQSVAQLTISGTQNAPFTISTAADPLTATGGATLTFSPSLWATSYGTNEPVFAYSWGPSSSGQFSSTGSFIFWLGGSLTVPAGQAAGQYAGTTTVTVQYQ